jgi:hypothetical protein
MGTSWSLFNPRLKRLSWLVLQNIESRRRHTPCQDTSGGYAEKWREQVSEIERKIEPLLERLAFHHTP